MTKENQDPTAMCDAMREAGVTSASSQAGIDFCTDECPYPLCKIADTARGRPTSDSYKALTKKQAIIAMNNNGIGMMDIALTLGISIRTVERITKHECMDEQD
jgi:hypothetical protein